MLDIITMAKTLLKIDVLDESQDQLSYVLASIAIRDAERYTKNDYISEEVELCSRMVQYLFNNLNNEGLASMSLATVSESYTSGSNAYPPSIMTALAGFTKLRTL